LRRYDPHDLHTLESRTRRPRRLRQPTWSAALEAAMLRRRRQCPRWGKDKLAVLLRGEGRAVSVSMVGRILGRLKQRGVPAEPRRNPISARRPSLPPPYAARKPHDYVLQAPGTWSKSTRSTGGPCPANRASNPKRF
jgi:hypothetical protein